MIIYQALKEKFLKDAQTRDIESVIQLEYTRRTGGKVSPQEINSWRESLGQMAKVMTDSDIPSDAGVAIEYKIPLTSKRVDFIVTGLDADDKGKAVIVELKQWSEAKRTDKDGIVLARRGGRSGEIEGPHPSYQAWSYAALLEGFNSAIHEDNALALKPCAYLHNYVSDGEIDHQFYAPHIERAPLFLSGERERKRLQDFIKKHVKRGDKGDLLYRIESGRIRPSKMLAESVLSMLRGNTEFVLIDDQKMVFETALSLARKAEKASKQVYIVKGGPGTGKSVIAVNLLATLTGLGKNCRYVSKNAAPRAVFETKLAGSFRRSQINNLFSGSGSFSSTAEDEFDVLIVDEAHRLNEKSGLYGNLGENQIKELIRAARCAVFFVDDDQRVTLKDIGDSEEIRKWALKLGARVSDGELASQFRCNGSDGYLAWLDNSLGIRPTANEILDTAEYDFRVLDSPTELDSLIRARHLEGKRARVVAGYCWPWNSKREPKKFDIELPKFGYRKQWNLSQDGSLWIIAENSIDQVGCIHTCQGLELDYVGVIVGPDLVMREGQLKTDPKGRARSDKSISGLKAMARQDAERAKSLADMIIKNTYRALMTRGMKGCYVYCTDAALADYLKKRIAESPNAKTRVEEPQTKIANATIIPFRGGRRSAARPANAVPVVDLKIAAGSFSDFQSALTEPDMWATVPEWVKPDGSMFVAQVVGESMNRRIPAGSWCLFRAHPSGTRNGKVVVAQHRSISDPDYGGSYTIKLYSSEKVASEEGGWRHARIRLSPDSDQAHFKPIVIHEDDAESLKIVAEFLMRLDPDQAS